MIVVCAYCGFDFDPLNGDHGCAESKPHSDLLTRLREDHGDLTECEHGFRLYDGHTCPNVVCLRRDLAEVVERLTE